MKFLSVIRPNPNSYEWKWRENHPNTTGIKIGDHCLFLGEIDNMPHHCAVIRQDGTIAWALHLTEFEIVPDAEL